MSAVEFRQVIDVHVMGAFNCTKAVWDPMREAKYGRIAMTTSVSGLFGNFGQANYAAAKMALIGLMNTLHIEGQKYDIRVNAVAPTAFTKMMEGLVDDQAAELLSVESVSPGLLYLVSENAPSKMILGAGAGGYTVSHIYETPGVHIADATRNPDEVASNIEAIAAPTPEGKLTSAFEQTKKFVDLANAARA